MKVDLTVSLSDQQVRTLLNALSLEDCKTAIRFLQRRLEQHQADKLLKTLKKKTGGSFMEIPIVEFELSKRTRLLLLRNKLTTVKDLTESGVDTLLNYPGFGKRTIKEIKEVIFLQEVDYV